MELAPARRDVVDLEHAGARDDQAAALQPRRFDLVAPEREVANEVALRVEDRHGVGLAHRDQPAGDGVGGDGVHVAPERRADAGLDVQLLAPLGAAHTDEPRVDVEDEQVSVAVHVEVGEVTARPAEGRGQRQRGTLLERRRVELGIAVVAAAGDRGPRHARAGERHVVHGADGEVGAGNRRVETVERLGRRRPDDGVVAVGRRPSDGEGDARPVGRKVRDRRAGRDRVGPEDPLARQERRLRRAHRGKRCPADEPVGASVRHAPQPASVAADDPELTHVARLEGEPAAVRRPRQRHQERQAAQPQPPEPAPVSADDGDVRVE